MHRFLATLAATLAAGSVLLAQQTKVIPFGMDFVEGPLVFTYPFGRADAAIHAVIDADRVTLSQGVITGLRFRQSRVTATQTYPSYTKNYRVTVYTVPTSAASMVPDLATNVGTATGTVVFQGPLVLPAVVAGSTFPHAFGIQIPFTTLYPYDGAQGNLLVHVETADTAAVPTGTYRIDAVNFAAATSTGLVADLDLGGCVANGQGLTLAANALQAVSGGSITTTLTSTGLGAFPLTMSVLSLDAQLLDLSSLGMAGCRAWVTPTVFQVATENLGGGYPATAWPIPANPAFEGLAVATQAFGVAASNVLSDCVTSNGLAVRIGPSSTPVRKAMCAFRSSTGWFMGGNGEFMPVIQLEGVFP